MNIFLMILTLIVGILFAMLIQKKTKMKNLRGYDVLPFFFIPAVQLLTDYHELPSFIPFGFVGYFSFVIIYSIYLVFRDRNIQLPKTLLQLWRYLILITLTWVIFLNVFLLF